MIEQLPSEDRVMDEQERIRQAAGGVRKVAAHLARELSVEDSWRLLLTGATWVMLGQLGDQGTADTLRELADSIESGEGVTVN